MEYTQETYFARQASDPNEITDRFMRSRGLVDIPEVVEDVVEQIEEAVTPSIVAETEEPSYVVAEEVIEPEPIVEFNEPVLEATVEPEVPSEPETIDPEPELVEDNEESFIDTVNDTDNALTILDEVEDSE